MSKTDQKIVIAMALVLESHGWDVDCIRTSWDLCCLDSIEDGFSFCSNCGVELPEKSDDGSDQLLEAYKAGVKAYQKATKKKK